MRRSKFQNKPHEIFHPKADRFLLLAGLAGLTGCNKPAEPSTGSGNQPGGGKKLTIALLPKSKGNAYFISCKKGADKAAADELGVDLIFDGPTDPDPGEAK